MERTVGSYLRSAREARGIAIEDAARVTRIGRNYLEALESDRFETLPNSAYVKGFLRAYAAFLGLSGDEAVAIYERSLSPVLHGSEEKEKGISETLRPPRPRRRAQWAVVVVLAGVVAMAAYVFEEMGGEPERPPVPVPAPGVVRSAPPVLPTVSSSSRPVEPSLPALEKEKPVSPSAGGVEGDGLVLKLKVHQDCWLNITIDRALSQQYDLKPGDVIEWKGSREFSLDIGNAGGIEGELNGKKLQPFGQPGKPIHIVLKGDATAPPLE